MALTRGPGYRSLLALAGPGFLVLGFLGRLPTSMLPLGLLLWTIDRGRGFGPAGLVVAALSLGAAAGGPLAGYLADRYGHRRFGLGVTAVGVAALTTFLWVSANPNGGLLPSVLVAAVLGLANPQVGAMARSRWAVLLRRPDTNHRATSAAMGWEAAADEAGFVVGPVAVGLLAALAPAAGLVAALALMLVAQVGFALHRSASRGQHLSESPDTSPNQPLPVAALVPLLILTLAVGVVFGSTQTVVTAILDVGGHIGSIGLVYGALGIGSALCGLLIARLSDRIADEVRLLCGGAALILASGGLVLSSSPGWLSLTCAVLGLGVAPVLVTSYTLASRRAPLARQTTAMTLLGTSTVSGVAAGAGTAGLVIDAVGASAGFLLVAAAGLTITLAAALMARTKRTRTASADQRG